MILNTIHKIHSSFLLSIGCRASKNASRPDFWKKRKRRLFIFQDGRSDRSSPFVSQEKRSFLSARDISFSTSTAYHPTGNSQCERFNQTIWRTIKLLLHGRGLLEDRWEEVLAEALHAVRSLVCLTTNETPHERLFRFPRRSMNGMALPS